MPNSSDQACRSRPPTAHCYFLNLYENIYLTGFLVRAYYVKTKPRLLFSERIRKLTD